LGGQQKQTGSRCLALNWYRTTGEVNALQFQYVDRGNKLEIRRDTVQIGQRFETLEGGSRPF